MGGEEEKRDGDREKKKGEKGEREEKICSWKRDTHDGCFAGTIGSQQGCDLVSVEGEGELLDSHFVAFVFLWHRY